MFVHLRQGSAVRNLSALLPGMTLAGMRRCLFCTDDAHPETLIGEGHMDRHLRLAVADGLDPVLAIVMATLNVAECYGLNKGAIAPGREADFVLMQDLKEFRAQQVYVQGRLAAERGRMLCATPLRPSEALTRSVRTAPLPDDAFDLRLASGRARVIGVQPGPKPAADQRHCPAEALCARIGSEPPKGAGARRAACGRVRPPACLAHTPAVP